MIDLQGAILVVLERHESLCLDSIEDRQRLAAALAEALKVRLY